MPRRASSTTPGAVVVDDDFAPTAKRAKSLAASVMPVEKENAAATHFTAAVDSMYGHDLTPQYLELLYMRTTEPEQRINNILEKVQVAEKATETLLATYKAELTHQAQQIAQCEAQNQQLQTEIARLKAALKEKAAVPVVQAPAPSILEKDINEFFQSFTGIKVRSTSRNESGERVVKCQYRDQTGRTGETFAFTLTYDSVECEYSPSSSNGKYSANLPSYLLDNITFEIDHAANFIGSFCQAMFKTFSL